ncbi:MAG: acyl-CoA dehydrogenase family protein [Pseudomonadota bacterium]
MTAELNNIFGDLLPAPQLTDAERELLVRVEALLAGPLLEQREQIDQAGRYPTQAMRALADTGLMRAALPAALGGMGCSQRFSLEVQLRIAMVDAAVAQLYKVHDELIREIPQYATAEQAARLAAEVVNNDAIVGLAVAETGRTAEEPLRTLCERQADGDWLINGEKIYTTGAAGADLIAIWAFNPLKATEDNPLLGMQLFLAPADTPGIVIHRDWNALGQRATDSGRLSLENVRCPDTWLASVPGKGPLIHASLRYQAGFAALLTGIGMGALQSAAPFVTETSRPWAAAQVESAADDPYIQLNLGNHAAALIGAYHATMQAADLFAAFEQGDINRGQLALPVSAAKVLAHKAALQACNEIHGLMGTRSVDRRYAFDLFWRNARTLSLHDPVDYKSRELGRHLLTGWHPPPGVYQ